MRGHPLAPSPCGSPPRGEVGGLRRVSGIGGVSARGGWSREGKAEEAGAGVDEGFADKALGEAVRGVVGRGALPWVDGAAPDSPT